MVLNSQNNKLEYLYSNLLLHTLHLIPKGIHILFSNKLLSDVTNTYTCFLNTYKMSNVLYVMLSNMLIQSKLFTDLMLADYPNYILRFLYISNTISLTYNIRILVKALVNYTLVLKTITNLYPCSSWCEREAWDLFGVFFSNNLDLRRILNDYGFHGHPLKKDFPLSGFSETFYSYILGVVLYKYLKMIQEFRFFNMNISWKFNYS